MKRIFAVLALVLLMAGTAFALSDTEYLRMRQYSAQFARADKTLNRVWAGLKRSLPKNVFAELQELQNEWITSGRDLEAQEYIDDGYSKAEAYTIVTNNRAEALPKLAQDLRRNINSPRTRPTPPAPKPEPVVQNGESDSEEVSDPSGEYESENAFMTVKIVDRSSMEAEVVISRWKDGVNWKATGWFDNGMIELSDPNYSTCQVSIVFDPDRARVVPSESEDWAKATADDFVIRGTYIKK